MRDNARICGTHTRGNNSTQRHPASRSTTHHASRITHHASRITHHASRITHTIPQYPNKNLKLPSPDDNVLQFKFKSVTNYFSVNCQTNLKALFCGWTCDSNQYQFMNASLNTATNISTLDIFFNFATSGILAFKL